MPTPFHIALDRLAALVVAGAAHNYGLDTVPDSVNRAQLPALLVLPGEPQESRLFKDRAEGFHALAFGDGARSVTYTVTHLLLVAPVAAGRGAQSHLPALIDLIDAYVATVAADVTLDGALAEPMQVKIEPGTYKYGAVVYHGCAFRHTWRMDV